MTRRKIVMKKLSKEHKATHLRLVKEIGCEMDKVMELASQLSVAIDTYNEKVEQANEWAQEVASELRQYYDDRSEAWQDGDNGSRFDEWVNAFEDFVIDGLDGIDTAPMEEAMETFTDLPLNLEDV